jgi:hypothetical protein
MKIELLAITDEWIETNHTSEEELLLVYKKATLSTETTKYKYYSNNNHPKQKLKEPYLALILFRVEKVDK